jgi:hypothetical protein
MTEKIHQVLDGELPASALNPQEADVLRQTKDAFRRVVHGLPHAAGIDLAPAVLARIRATKARAHTAGHQPRWRTAIEWLWSPRPLSLQWRPAYAFGLIAALFIAVSVADPTNHPVATSPQQVLVQFRLDAPSAHQVQLAGNFTSWKADVSLKRSASGVWTVVLPLTPGVHNYAFVIDGEQWVADPMAQEVADGFGGTNSQVAVLTPDNTTVL